MAEIQCNALSVMYPLDVRVSLDVISMKVTSFRCSVYIVIFKVKLGNLTAHYSNTVNLHPIFAFEFK